jgi:hypothetical protein
MAYRQSHAQASAASLPTHQSTETGTGQYEYFDDELTRQSIEEHFAAPTNQFHQLGDSGHLEPMFPSHAATVIGSDSMFATHPYSNMTAHDRFNNLREEDPSAWAVTDLGIPQGDQSFATPQQEWNPDHPISGVNPWLGSNNAASSFDLSVNPFRYVSSQTSTTGELPTYSTLNP